MNWEQKAYIACELLVTAIVVAFVTCTGIFFAALLTGVL